MYLLFQIILTSGLLYSTSADGEFYDIIENLSVKNVQEAQNEFFNCVVKLDIYNYIDRDTFNVYLSTLRDHIVSREIHPNDTSTKIIEFLELDESYISEEFISCCDIFHSSLFDVEKPKFEDTDDLNVMMYLRFEKAFDVMCNCLENYSAFQEVDECDRKEMSTQNYKNQFRIFTIKSLFKGLIYSTSAEAEFHDIIKYLSSKNLQEAQNKFYNCVVKLDINKYIESDTFNVYLSTLKDHIVSREIHPNDMSTKIIEFLELDESYISEEFKSCCNIFHSNLFDVEKPKFEESVNLNILLYLRFEKAFDVMYDCLENYNSIKDVDENYRIRYGITEPFTCRRNMSTYESKKRYYKSTMENLYDVIIEAKTPNEIVNDLKNSIHSRYYEEPFAKYCAAVYYTYMVTYNSTLNEILNLVGDFMKNTNNITLED
ncbi:uncharacterized protein LOC126894911 [Daktulosphaira vitifoliae]|uniref:uncharacterized protein LOC126894911 n=1 Tax=Daktulosphaira vitifoliae TaxID=58002 RepID=UPI0021A9BE60|nr:uncharacterized protein LOC126894911 [Daktulosphaira vitifoliae]